MRAPVLIRDAEVHDVATLARTHVDVWRSTYRGLIPDAHLDALSYAEKEKQWTAWITNSREGTRRLVAVLDGTVIGFAIIGDRRPEHGNATCELYALYINTDFQGKGIGSALLEASIEWLRDQGHSFMHLNVLKGNRPSIEFYRSKGALPIGEASVTIDGNEYLDEMYEIDLKAS